MPVGEKDRRVLRDLARKVAEAAALPVQAERTRLWRDFNALRPRRPMVLAFPEGGWRDLVGESQLQCEDPALRRWELGLRRQIFHVEHVNDDRPVTDFFNVRWSVDRGDYGVRETYTRADPLGSHVWDPPIKTPADFEKLRLPTITVDRQATARSAELAEEVLGDILRVRVHGSMWWTVGLTWTLIRLRGLDQMMLDTYDDPAFLHRLMGFLRDALLYEIETLQDEGVLSLNNGPDDYVGSGALGCTDELPAEDFGGTVRIEDLWGLAESQETVGVSPAQFEEFVLPYQLPLANRFGLLCYGCCEPVDRRLDMLMAQIPRLRRVSVSPWSDRAVAAEKLADRYVYSWKPNPTMICAPTVDWDAVERATRETLEIAKGCCLEMVMKDTHTFQGDPTRPGRWVEIASRLAGA